MATRRFLPNWWSWRTTLSLVFLALLVVPPAAVVAAYSGVYSVAASHGHPQWLNWFLSVGMRRSVQVNARPLTHPDLTDPGLIALGAAHFQGGCAPCHAAPGQRINAVFGGMLPQPPRLEEQVSRWQDHELHWIVYNGLQYAGMPGWSGAEREDEVWALVAFLRTLPDLDAAGYEALALRNDSGRDPAALEIISSGVATGQLASCGRCHDAPGLDPVGSLTPALGGLSKPYLVRSLRDYREGRRQSGIMEPVATQLDDADIERLAEYYSGESPAPRTPPSRDPESVARGAVIAQQGVAGERVSACNACHGVSAKPEYPRLDGQPAAYLEAQLRLFREGHRGDGPYATLMAGIAAHLDESQARDVAAYYEARAR